MCADMSNSLRKLSHRSQSLVRRLSLVLSIIAASLALRFLFYPAGKALFLPFDGVALLILGVWSLLIAVPLSCVGLLDKETRLGSIVNLLFSVAPLPLYLLIFKLINEAKGFTFW
jgi:hypothetical protein